MNALSPASIESLGRALRAFNLGRLTVFTCLFLGLLVIPAFGQEATIVGTVTDPTGAAVAGAKVTLTNTDSGIERTLTAGADGQYVAPDLRRVDRVAFGRGYRRIPHDDFELQRRIRPVIAGTLSMVIKSGTKTLHAGAWYFGRNDALDARNYFNPAPNQYNPALVSRWQQRFFGRH